MFCIPLSFIVTAAIVGGITGGVMSHKAKKERDAQAKALRESYNHNATAPPVANSTTTADVTNLTDIANLTSVASTSHRHCNESTGLVPQGLCGTSNTTHVDGLVYNNTHFTTEQGNRTEGGYIHGLVYNNTNFTTVKGNGTSGSFVHKPVEIPANMTEASGSVHNPTSRGAVHGNGTFGAHFPETVHNSTNQTGNGVFASHFNDTIHHSTNLPDIPGNGTVRGFVNGNVQIQNATNITDMGENGRVGAEVHMPAHNLENAGSVVNKTNIHGRNRTVASAFQGRVPSSGNQTNGTMTRARRVGRGSAEV
jgi:hypothetical protein